MKSRMKIVRQEHIAFKGRWLQREKRNRGKRALPCRGSPVGVSFQVSSATEARAHLDSHMFNIAILPQTPQAPTRSPGASLHLMVSWVGGLVISA